MELEKQFLFQIKHFIIYDGFKGSLPDDSVLNKALCETWHGSLQEIKNKESPYFFHACVERGMKL